MLLLANEMLPLSLLVCESHLRVHQEGPPVSRIQISEYLKTTETFILVFPFYLCVDPHGETSLFLSSCTRLIIHSPPTTVTH